MNTASIRGESPVGSWDHISILPILEFLYEGYKIHKSNFRYLIQGFFFFSCKDADSDDWQKLLLK